MNIIYLTDIHDDLRKVRSLIQKTRADLYLISGDLIYQAFISQEKLYHYLELQEHFYTWLHNHQLPYTPYELALEILRKPDDYSVELALDAAEYRFLFQNASRTMKAKYEILQNLFKKYASAPVLTIPGNYDMDLQYTALAGLDLHRRCQTVGGLKICGYGGAPILTPGIPELLSVVFHEYPENGRLVSEPCDFFSQQNPDIVLIHNPAYGTLDRLPARGHIGSMGIRNFLDQHQPQLVLSGHLHEDCGLLRLHNTYFLNPSNFGSVETGSGQTEGGYFCRIVFSGEPARLESIVWQRLHHDQIVSIAEVSIDSGGARETITDPAEFAAAGGFLR